MRIDLHDVAKGHDAEALPPTSLTVRSGRATLATAETEQRPTVLGLIASGRMHPDDGTIRLDGVTGARSLRALRRSTALIDAPGVSDPAPDVITAGVVGEELMFARRAADPLAARRWLDSEGLRHLSRTAIGEVPAADRVRLLLELAALRPGVEALVLVSPDRHGGDPHAWWATALEFADRGYAVLVIAGEAAGGALGRSLAGRVGDAPTVGVPTHPRVHLRTNRRPAPSGIRLRSMRPGGTR